MSPEPAVRLQIARQIARAYLALAQRIDTLTEQTF